MYFFFLDVVDVVPARSAGGLGYIFYLVLAATILVEAGIMLGVKYNPFGKSLLHSFVVNAASVASGFLLFELVPDLFDPYKIPKLLGMFLVTVGIELPVLYLLNKQQSLRQTIRVCLLMNAVTYFLFWLYIHYVV